MLQHKQKYSNSKAKSLTQEMENLLLIYPYVLSLAPAKLLGSSVGLLSFSGHKYFYS